MGANATDSIEPKAHHFVSQKGGGHLDGLGHHRTPQRETLWRKAGQIFAFAKNDAGGRTQLAAHKPDKRRLPCSVRSDEDGHAPSLDIERDGVDQRLTAQAVARLSR